MLPDNVAREMLPDNVAREMLPDDVRIYPALRIYSR
jgi:hypothetical protein